MIIKEETIMNIKILRRYFEICKQYGLEPNWNDLIKFKEGYQYV